MAASYTLFGLITVTGPDRTGLIIHLDLFLVGFSTIFCLSRVVDQAGYRSLLLATAR